MRNWIDQDEAYLSACGERELDEDRVVSAICAWWLILLAQQQHTSQIVSVSFIRKFTSSGWSATNQGVVGSNPARRTSHFTARKKKPLGLCGRQRLEGGISKEEEEKPRTPILQEQSSSAIELSNRTHQLFGTHFMYS